MGIPRVIALLAAWKAQLAWKACRGSLLMAAYIGCLSVFAGVLLWGLLQWCLGVSYGDLAGLDRFSPRVLTLSYPIGVVVATAMLALGVFVSRRRRLRRAAGAGFPASRSSRLAQGVVAIGLCALLGGMLWLRGWMLESATVGVFDAWLQQGMPAWLLAVIDDSTRMGSTVFQAVVVAIAFAFSFALFPCRRPLGMACLTAVLLAGLFTRPHCVGGVTPIGTLGTALAGAMLLLYQFRHGGLRRVPLWRLRAVVLWLTAVPHPTRRAKQSILLLLGLAWLTLLSPYLAWVYVIGFPLCLVLYPAAKRRWDDRDEASEERLDFHRPPKPWGRVDWRWAVVGLLLLVGALWFLESASPYYFSQDDNLATSLPNYLYACRSIWAGKIPEYSPYCFLGSPLLSRGMGESYPPLHLSYGVARYVLGDECATLEVLGIADLIVAYIAMVFLMRRAGMRGMVACLAALTFVLSGSILVMGRSWAYFLSGAALSALLALAAERLRDGPVGWRWVVGVGLLIGLYYHVGFPQLWVYGVGFFLLHAACLCLTKVVPLRRVLRTVPALLLGIGIAFPLFYVQWRLVREMPSEPGYGDGITTHLLSLLLPNPLYRGVLPNCYGTEGDSACGGHLFYYGSLMFVLFFLATIDWLAQAIGRRPRRRGSHVWTFCGMVAFVMCLGHDGYLWSLLSNLATGLKNYPFRVLPFFVLFSVLSGAAILERLLKRFPRWHILDTGVIVVAGGLLLRHVVVCAQVSFYTYGYHPYPVLPAPLVQLLRSPGEPAPHRMLYYAPERSTNPTYPYCLPHSLPAYYEVPSLFGYDPIFCRKSLTREMVARVRKDPETALSAYGVRWLLIDPALPAESLLKPASPDTPRANLSIFDPMLVSVPVAGCHGIALPGDVVMQVAELFRPPAPLCFSLRTPEQALPVAMDSEGVYVDLRGLNGAQPLVVNFLRWPDMNAYVDGQLTPIQEDEWDRMVVRVPKGAQKLAVLYQSPWGPGIAVGVGCLLAALCGLAVLGKGGR